MRKKTKIRNTNYYNKNVPEMKNRIRAYKAYISTCIMIAPLHVHAGDGSSNDGSAQWNTVMDFLLTWIPRLGGLMLFGGAIEYAIAYQSENAGQKTNAVRIMVAGGMLIGIPLAISSLIKI